MDKNFIHGVSEAELIRLTRRLNGLHGRTTPVAFVAVFGSRVKGTHRPNSDLDVVLAFLTGGKEARESPRIAKIAGLIRADFLNLMGFELDLNMFDIDEIGPKTKFGPKDLIKL
jgi:predicted nucleotidyltransferase